jgi:hypothetical protein
MAICVTLEATTKSGLTFATHVCIATVVLGVVAMAAVGLGFFHHWLASFPTDRVPPFIPISVQFLEYGVYGLDIVTFCLYVGVNAFGFWKDLFK